MTPEKFTIHLYNAVIEDNLRIYRDLFSCTSAENASDPYWKRALLLFSSLSKEEKEVFFEVVRQIAIDTTSNVLGIIDGVSSFDEPGMELHLSCGSKRLDGDLQSLFLTEDEKRNRTD
jgi:hypothetical protein